MVWAGCQAWLGGAVGMNETEGIIGDGLDGQVALNASFRPSPRPPHLQPFLHHHPIPPRPGDLRFLQLRFPPSPTQTH